MQILTEVDKKSVNRHCGMWKNIIPTSIEFKAAHSELDLLLRLESFSLEMQRTLFAFLLSTSSKGELPLLLLPPSRCAEGKLKLDGSSLNSGNTEKLPSQTTCRKIQPSNHISHKTNHHQEIKNKRHYLQYNDKKFVANCLSSEFPLTFVVTKTSFP